MPLTFRHLKSQSDLDAYMDLCVYCFSMTPEYTKTYARIVAPHLDLTWGAFENGRLLACMRYIPYDMHVGGAYLPMGGVAAVATAPEARNLGLAKQLMTKAHRQMKDEGRPLAVLMPFKPEFYARMGYGDVFYYQDAKLRPEALRRNVPREYKIVPVDGLAEWKTFERLQIEYGSRYFGTVRRDQRYWKLRYLESVYGLRYSYLVTKSGKPAGFLITHLDKPEPAYAPELSRGTQLSMVQAVWLDTAALNTMLHFVYGHRDQFKTVRWRLPADIPIRQVDEQMDVMLKPKMMLKLVNLKTAVELRPFSPDLDGELLIQVKGDDTSPWNDGLWRIEWNKGKPKVVKANSRPRSGIAKTDVQTMAVIYSGHRLASRLAELGLISGPSASIALLDRAFPAQSCYIDEWF